MLNEAEYQALQSKPRAHVFTFRNQPFNAGTIVNSPEAEQLLSNQQTSAIEQYEFCHNLKPSYFCYVHLKSAIVTTWIGTPLGRIAYLGSSYRLFGQRWNKAQSLVVISPTGIIFYGTFYASSGDYCILRAYKHQPEAVLMARHYGWL